MEEPSVLDYLKAKLSRGRRRIEIPPRGACFETTPASNGQFQKR
jgi:hypothetical protein